jgi:adenylate kinase family enzyme
LTQAPDDKAADIVLERLREYEEFTAPIIGYYERESNLYRVSGMAGIDGGVIKNILEPIAWG